MAVKLQNLMDLDVLSEQTPALTRRMLQHWLATNLDGFREACTMKVNRRVLFDKEAVEGWLDRHREGAPTTD